MVADFLPVVIGQIDAQVPRNSVQVNRRIGRAADGRVDHNRIFKRRARHHVGGPQVFPNHVDDALAGLV